ncbi:MAG: hypothetical protein IPM76_27845 [Chloroflexi bacterium]|nr:hypothetical protein [Chloroflexota bacterium]
MVQDCEVAALPHHQPRHRRHHQQGEFHAPIVVNAAGPWAKAVGAMVGLDLPIDTWRHDTMFIRRPASIGPSHPTVIDMANSSAFARKPAA